MKHLFEYIIFRLLLDLFRLLPFKVIGMFAAILGGFIATLPFSFNVRARSNLKKVFPDKDEKWIQHTQYTSMVNLAKTFFEFSSIYNISDKKLNQMVEYNGLDNLKNNQNAFILTAHLGNWDVICRMMGIYCEHAGNIYRATNNPYVNSYMVNMRAKSGGEQIPKGSKGARKIVKFLKTGGVLGMLMDQKMNDGIESTFLGQPAMTAPALSELAAKFDIPILPVSAIRQKNGKFIVTIDKPIKVTGNKEKDTQKCNDILSDMIYQNPEQWMWVHKRFKE